MKKDTEQMSLIYKLLFIVKSMSSLQAGTM